MKKYVFDMDNVLADFDITEPNALERFQSEENFFLHLKPLDTVVHVNELIAKGELVYIVSASPHEKADKDKRAWLRKHIPNLKPHQVILCRLGEDKAQYIKDIANSTLIDDYTYNLTRWIDKGGKAIKFLNGTNGKKGISKALGIKQIKDIRQLV